MQGCSRRFAFNRVARHGAGTSPGWPRLQPPRTASPQSLGAPRHSSALLAAVYFASPNAAEVCFSHAPARDGGIAFLLGCFDGIGEADLYQGAPKKEGELVDSDDKSRDKNPEKRGPIQVRL